MLKIIDKTLQDDAAMGTTTDKTSLLATILRSEGLDDKDKISGVIGE